MTDFGAVRGSILGDTLSTDMGLPEAGVPDHTGYAIGYRLVRQYVERAGQTVAEATRIPANEIIAVSGFLALWDLIGSWDNPREADELIASHRRRRGKAGHALWKEER